MQKRERLFEVSRAAHEVGEAEGLSELLFFGVAVFYFTHSEHRRVRRDRKSGPGGRITQGERDGKGN